MERELRPSSIEVRPSSDVLATTRKTATTVAYCDMLVGSHRLRLLKDGAQTFAAMLEAIGRARSTICLETYILRDDSVGQAFAKALRERALAGVEVNLLFDAWGSSVSDE